MLLNVLTRRFPLLSGKLQHARVTDFLTAVCAIHLSSYVETKFRTRGGLFIVGPPGSLKSTCVEFLDGNFSDALVLSDINTQTLVKLKDRISGNTIRTLVLSDMQKLYERHQSVARGIEGTLRALASEGFSAASFEDQSIARVKARATVIGAMTNETRESMASRWETSGFSRRFLWSLVRLRDPSALERSVVRDELIQIAQAEVPRIPVSGKIPNTTTQGEREQIQIWCKYQPSPHNEQITLLVKAWAVMKWWSKTQKRAPTRAWDSMRRFALSLGREGVEVEIE